MKSVISSAASCLLISLTSTATLASAVYTFDFDVTSYSCLLSDCRDESFYRGKLESMTLDLTPQAISDEEAALHYATYGWGGAGPADVRQADNQGFAAAGLGAWGVALDLSHGICGAYSLCNIQANLNLPTSDFLRGSFRLDTSNDNVHMSSSGSHLWSGYIYSDGPFQTYSPYHFPTFTGKWQLRNSVPEPGALVLFLTGLTAMGLFLGRRLRQTCRQEAPAR